MQIRRPSLQQECQESQGGGIPQPLHLVEGDDEWSPERLDFAHYQPDSTLRSNGGVVCVRYVEEVQSGARARQRDVGVEHGWFILLVQRDPGRSDPFPAHPTAALCQQRRLAKTTRRLQHRQPPARGGRPIHELGTVDVSRHGFRNRNLLPQ